MVGRIILQMEDLFAAWTVQLYDSVGMTDITEVCFVWKSRIAHWKFTSMALRCTLSLYKSLWHLHSGFTASLARQSRDASVLSAERFATNKLILPTTLSTTLRPRLVLLLSRTCESRLEVCDISLDIACVCDERRSKAFGLAGWADVLHHTSVSNSCDVSISLSGRDNDGFRWRRDMSAD